jgi:tetratricopeptide (TPR) repeat protein
MEKELPEQQLVEVTNPIINRAYFMIGMQTKLESAVESLRADRELQSKSDEELIRIINEADQHWRDQYEDCIRKPGVIEMYAPLMSACCKQRYDKLWELRKTASEAEKEALNARMGRLLTIQAHCALANAESLLLNEQFKQAYDEFGQAEWLARALPDEGSLRVYEILWARYGQMVTASIADRNQEFNLAKAGIQQMLSALGPYAQQSLSQIERLFSPHRWVFTERERIRQEIRDHPEQAQNPSAEESSNVTSLIDLVDTLATKVQMGQMTIAEAKDQARAAAPALDLQPGMLMNFARVCLDTIVRADPERSVCLEEINCELALHFQDEPYVEAFCLSVLGTALIALAQKAGTGYERAVEGLERAFEVMSIRDNPEDRRNAASICNQIGMANRDLSNAAQLMKWSQKGAELWEAIPGYPDDLGTAYGLRAEAQELQGAIDAALEDHFRALSIFRDARSMLNVRRAYHHIFDCCLRSNRLSEAAAAGNDIVEIAQGLGDLDDVTETTFRLAPALVRINRVDLAMPFLVRSDLLTIEALKKDPENRKLLASDFDHRIWAARILLPLLSKDSELPNAKKREFGDEAYRHVESARQIALHLRDDNRLTEAILEHALLQESIGNFDAAESFCMSVDFIPGCPPGLRAFSFLIMGRMAAQREQFTKAKDLLDFGLKTLGDGSDEIRVRHLSTRGKVREGLGDDKGAIEDYEEAVRMTMGFRNRLAEESQVKILGIAESALERLFILYVRPSALQDTKRALYWAEYGKSRGLSELLGQSEFTAPAPSPETKALYQEEHKLLAEIHSSRARSIADAAQITMDETHAMRTRKARLNQIWDTLESQFPEYVELRRGAVPSWSEILELTTA